MYCIYIYRITGPSWFNSRVMRESLAGTMPRKLQVHADIIDKTLPDTVSGRAHCGEEKKKKKEENSTIQMAKADLKSAFHVCPVHPRDWQLLGIRWRTQFFIDKCLPLGFSSQNEENEDKNRYPLPSKLTSTALNNCQQICMCLALRFRRFTESSLTFSSGSNYINASYIHACEEAS